NGFNDLPFSVGLPVLMLRIPIFALGAVSVCFRQKEDECVYDLKMIG
ncbi:MAG: hypothetical protein RLZZ519_3246, partial [Bacteroidota bacterium]